MKAMKVPRLSAGTTTQHNMTHAHATNAQNTQHTAALALLRLPAHHPCLLMFCITVVYVVNVIAAPGMPRNSATGKPRHNRPTPSRATKSRAVDKNEGEGTDERGEAAGLVVGETGWSGCGVCVCMMDLIRSWGKANVQKPIPPATHNRSEVGSVNE